MTPKVVPHVTEDKKPPHLQARKRLVSPLPPHEPRAVFSEEHRRLVEAGIDPMPEHFDSNGAVDLDTTTMDRVRVEPVEWLWPGWLALGKLALLEGKPSLGKSTLALTLAARVTTGTPWPDQQQLGERREPRNVVLLSAEDSAGDTLKPRLLEAGADCTRVTLVRGVWHTDNEGNRQHGMLHLPADTEKLERVVHAVNAALIIVDVLAAYTGGARGGGSSNTDADVRTLLNPLCAMLDRTRAHGLALRHWTKAGDDDLVMRGGGSIAYSAAARHIYACVQHPENEDLMVLVCAKNNLAPKAEPLSYSIVSGQEYNTARVQWRGPIDITVQELMRRRREANTEDDANEGERARGFVMTALMDGPLPATMIITAGMDAGFSKATLQRAATELHVQKVREQQPDGAMRSVWHLND